MIRYITDWISIGKGKGMITGQVIGKWTRIRIWGYTELVPELPTLACRFHITGWHLGKVGEGGRNQKQPTKGKRGTNEVTWTRCHLGLVKLPASDTLVTFLECLKWGTAQKWHRTFLLSEKKCHTVSCKKIPSSFWTNHNGQHDWVTCQSRKAKLVKE